MNVFNRLCKENSTVSDCLSSSLSIIVFHASALKRRALQLAPRIETNPCNGCQANYDATNLFTATRSRKDYPTPDLIVILSFGPCLAMV
jgi:hypothetical protein